MDFYGMPESPVCRSVALTAKYLGVSVNKKHIDVFADGHKSPEFTKINPAQCVPTIVDGDLTLWESGAIQIYLASKYAKDDVLYPNDPVKQAKINRVIFFVVSSLLPKFMQYQVPITMEGKTPDAQKKEKVIESVGLVDKLLEGRQYAMGDKITLADHSLVPIVSTIKEMGFGFPSMSNIVPWLTRCQNNMAGYESENLEGAKKLAAFIKSKSS